ncbi:MAG: hypothetical protein QNK23_17415 [Crocinitomicaceae bacterium]|nr:hypothetical protein [Crocinitomicaceae bacterium]
MKFKLKYGLILLTLLSVPTFGQDESETFEEEPTEKKWKEKIDFGGYVKYMTTVQFLDVDNIYVDNLLHNRLNFKWMPNKHWTFSIEMRNRVFYGETQKLNPNFNSLIGTDPGVIDMSWNLLESNSMLINSTIDRANIEFNKGKWNVRLGRQRINWGMNLAWNPNDLFNAYNFIDFDYQERPGSDALRIQYFNKPMSQIELAYKPGKDLDHSIIAGMYRFNKKGYDFQFIAANYNSDVTAGFGWAGNIVNVGFKGEISYFHPKYRFSDTTGALVSSISFDYTFKKGLYINVAGLYNSAGPQKSSLAQLQSMNSTLSAKNLLPTQFAAFVQLAGSFNPIFGGGISVMYLPSINGVFFIPTLSYSIRENWDIDLVGQVLFAESNNNFINLSNSIFLRLRWSF